MPTKFGKTLVSLLGLLIIGWFGCSGESDQTADKMEIAVAEMQTTEGNEAHGTVTFTKVEGGVQVVAHFEGVPEGEHGFHIHEFGDCSSGDGKSAGGHFNPAGVAHAGPNAEERHIGDLGNITADANGMAHADFVDSHLRIMGDYSIVGKGVVLHADPDDMTSQPTGAAGARISCGVIKMKAKEMAEK